MRAVLALAFATALTLSGCGFFHHGPGDGDGGDDDEVGLDGTWVLRSATFGDSLYVPSDRERNVLRLRRGETEVQSCNACGGRYRQDERRQVVSFLELGCTEMACERQIDLGPELSEAPLRYRVSERELVLHRQDDRRAATFTFYAAE